MHVGPQTPVRHARRTLVTSSIAVLVLAAGACAAPAEPEPHAYASAEQARGEAPSPRSLDEQTRLAASPEGAATREGDILVPPARGIAANREVYKPWPGGVVPYIVDPGLAAADVGWVRHAIAHWAKWTGIRFVPRTNQADHVVFRPHPSSCSSYVGRIGGAQTIYVPDWCQASVIHEIGHAVGLDHEQNRSDRDRHVTIHFGNVQADAASNFQKMNRPSFGFYDFESIMHYGPTAFSANGYPTITRVDGEPLVVQRRYLSWGDVEGVNALYADEALPDPEAHTRATTTGEATLWASMAVDAPAVRTIANAAPVVRSGYRWADYEYVRHDRTWGWIASRVLPP